MTQIPRHAVSQGSFELCPDEFIWIEFRGVAWETMGVKPRVFTEELLDRGRLMGFAAIPQQDHGAAQVPEQLPKETSHLWEADILVAVEPGIEGDAPAFWGDADRRDGRDFGPSASTAEIGGLSPWGPRAGNVGDQKETALIEKRQVGPKSFSFFLYEATDTVSSDGWRPRPVPWPFSLASGSSSPGPSSASSNWRWSSVSQSAWPPPHRCVLESTGLWGNQQPGALLPEARRAFSFALGTTTPGVQESAWEEVPRGPFSCTPDASAPRNLKRRSLWRLRSGSSGQTLTSEWREAFAFPMYRVCHGVSCPIG